MSRSTLLVSPLLLALVACPPKKDTGTEDPDPCDEPVTWYADADGDGFGSPTDTTEACTQPDGTLPDGTDCDDGNADVNPAAPELCDEIDNDCDGSVDEDVKITYYEDTDGDGYGQADSTTQACTVPAGWAENGTDCDDDAAGVNPGADETCDWIDDDCDGLVDDADDTLADPATFYSDADGDGWGDATTTTTACNQPPGFAEEAGDCDDANAAANPGAEEVCDGVDNDCNGATDGDDPGVTGTATWYRDLDGDAYGDPDRTSSSCDAPDGYVASDEDCNDRNASIHPGAPEVCDGIDNDCDDAMDDADASVSGTLVYYADTDADGFGDPRASTEACEAPTGYVEDASDCDDTAATTRPGAAETCDGIDQDCDLLVDEEPTDGTVFYSDGDGDGVGNLLSTTRACEQPDGWASLPGDCDDANGAVYPGATELCNGFDDNCNGMVDSMDPAMGAVATWYLDADGDGAGDPTVSTTGCAAPTGYVATDDDCDDTNAAIHPEAGEVCNGVDDDCDGTIDDDPTDGSDYFEDADGDGFGAPGTLTLGCTGVTNDWDCDDTTAEEPQVVDALADAASADGSADHPWISIQEGIDAASQCVVVRAGSYTENLTFDGKGLSVRGVDGALATVVNGLGREPVVRFDQGETAEAELSGFTLTNGMGFQSVDTLTYTCGSTATCTDHFTVTCGGGLYVGGATPTLHDLVIEGNNLATPSDSTSGTDRYYYLSYGGGICVRDATVTLDRVHLYDNYADDGGGLYVEATATVSLSHARVAGNTAETGGAFEVDGGSLTLLNVASSFNKATSDGGGSRAIGGSLREINVTHAGDDAPTGGGLYASGGATLTLVNTIVWGAATGVGVLVADPTTAASVSYSDVYGNAGGGYGGIADPTGTSGNLAVDPAFLAVTDDGDVRNEDLRLDTGSPCVDAGNPSATYYDPDGTRNDLGAWGGPGGAWE